MCIYIYIYISYIHVNQKVHRETVLTRFCYKKCTIKSVEKKFKQYEILVLQQTSYPDCVTHFICLARQTEIQVAQLSTVRITQKSLLATQEKQHLHFQKLTTNLVLRILILCFKISSTRSNDTNFSSEFIFDPGKPQIKNSIICG